MTSVDVTTSATIRQQSYVSSRVEERAILEEAILETKMIGREGANVAALSANRSLFSRLSLAPSLPTGDARKHAHALELSPFSTRLLLQEIDFHRHGVNRCSAINVSPLQVLRGGWQNPTASRLQGRDPSKIRGRCHFYMMQHWHGLINCGLNAERLLN
jgi:hypothetical protein